MRRNTCTRTLNSNAKYMIALSLAIIIASGC
jgi:hypothetical protein